MAGQMGQEALTLQSIFFGGGTPSLMDPEMVEALIQEALSLWPSVENLEITLEANPTSVEAQKFQHFQRAGVNRLSLGIQSLSAEELVFLGRQHTPEQSHQALKLASEIFPRFSFDLIYALPHQTPKAWEEELNQALDHYQPSHISLYQLTYEPGTPFYTRFKRGDLTEPLEDTAVALFEITEACTHAHGLERYEISNYAAMGQASRHNMGYWQGDPYLGIGPGAHGRLKRNGNIHTTQTHKMPEKWLAQVETMGHGVVEQTTLTPQQRFIELFSMGLRLQDGLSLPVVLAQTGKPVDEWVSSETLDTLEIEKLIIRTPEKLALTAQGRLRLNAILAYCLKAS